MVLVGVVVIVVVAVVASAVVLVVVGVAVGAGVVVVAAAANAAVGLSAGGATLTQQVSALLEATGLRPTAHASMTPRSCLSTQTRPDYYKLLLEQKRRDGIL